MIVRNRPKGLELALMTLPQINQIFQIPDEKFSYRKFRYEGKHTLLPADGMMKPIYSQEIISDWRKFQHLVVFRLVSAKRGLMYC